MATPSINKEYVLDRMKDFHSPEKQEPSVFKRLQGK